jgi:hypothetical protein
MDLPRVTTVRSEVESRPMGLDMDVDGCRVPLVGSTMPLVICTFADQESLFRSQPMPRLTHCSRGDSYIASWF